MTPAQEKQLAAAILNPWYDREADGAREKNPVAWRAVRDIADLAHWIAANRVNNPDRTPYAPEVDPEDDHAAGAEFERAERQAEAERHARERMERLSAARPPSYGDAVVRASVTITEYDIPDPHNIRPAAQPGGQED